MMKYKKLLVLLDISSRAKFSEIPESCLKAKAMKSVFSI